MIFLVSQFPPARHQLRFRRACPLSRAQARRAGMKGRRAPQCNKLRIARGKNPAAPEKGLYASLGVAVFAFDLEAGNAKLGIFRLFQYFDDRIFIC